jgi:ribosome biogenesis GTPase
MQGMNAETRRRLSSLGFEERIRALSLPSIEAGLGLGRVARVDRGSSFVLTAGEPVRAKTLPQLHRGPESLAPPTIGDWVAFRVDGNGQAYIERILPRSSVFARGAPDRQGVAQVLAANIDVVFLVQALSRPVNLRRLERELVLAWQSGATPVVVLNKVDLVTEQEAQTMLKAARSVALETPVQLACAITGRGIEALVAYSEGHRTIAVLGASGVGKSTLVNRALGRETQETQEVREADSRGRHTTVTRELLLLPGGGALIDTPGLRALPLHSAEAGLERAFADIAALAESCRFRDCAHGEEPGCAVREAEGRGDLPPGRVDSYVKLRLELEADAAAALPRGGGRRQGGRRPGRHDR